MPVPPTKIKEFAMEFFKSVANRNIIEAGNFNSELNKFEPKKILSIFLSELINCQKKLLNSQIGTEVSAKCVNIIRNCWINVNLYY